MIVCRKSKTNLLDRSAVAMCDLCHAECRESVVIGKAGTRAADEAERLAKEAGWQERLTKVTNPRRRRMTWTVELLCPACAALPGGCEG